MSRPLRLQRAANAAADVVREEVQNVEEILAEIEERLDELGERAPEHQRLLMLIWMARARACVERAKAIEVHTATAKVAKRFSDLAKVLWPGSVRALQLGVTPEQALGPTRRGFYPRSWSDVADAADILLVDRMNADERAGRDEYGYADERSLRPRIDNPDGVATRISQDLAQFESAFDVAKAERTAIVVRHLRGQVEGRSFGELIGRLRRQSKTLGGEGTRLRDLIDPAFVPDVPWPRLLKDPLAIASPPSTAKTAPPPPDAKALVARAPSRGISKDDLIAWLREALPALPATATVALLDPVRDEVAALASVDVFADRRTRRRWRDVLKAMSLLAEMSSVPEEEPVAPDDDEPDVDLAAADFDALVARVKKHTAGRDALFVSNRDDGELQEKLSSLLGLNVTWFEATPRRLQAAAERITRGDFAFILSASGFQDHASDATLAKAARSAGVRLIRVNRGRPVACVLALARELGLTRASAVL